MSAVLPDPNMCPVCRTRAVKPVKPFRLYEVPVCRKCYYRLANRRQLAFIVDISEIRGFVVLIPILANWAGLFSASSAASTMAFGVFLAALSMLLPAFKDGFSGRSLGKWLLGLQVVHSSTQQPIRFESSFLRNLPIVALYGFSFAMAIFFPALLGVSNLVVLLGLLIMAYMLNRGPRPGDGLAGTKVIWSKFHHRPPFDTRGILCTNCGYNLTGNVSGICPECGQETSKRPNAETPKQENGSGGG